MFVEIFNIQTQHIEVSSLYLPTCNKQTLITNCVFPKIRQSICCEKLQFRTNDLRNREMAEEYSLRNKNNDLIDKIDVFLGKLLVSL